MCQYLTSGITCVKIFVREQQRRLSDCTDAMVDLTIRIFIRRNKRFLTHWLAFIHVTINIIKAIR